MASIAGAIRAGRAFVELFADDSKLVSGLRRAQSTLDNFGRDLLRLGIRIQAIGASLAAPFVLSAKIFTETGDRLDAMSKRTGFAVESLSQLELATQLTDFTMQGFENALKRMQRTIVQMATGTNEQSRALKFLHLNLAEVVKLNSEEQFKLIGERLSLMQDATMRAGAAMAIFGREATGVLPMLSAGADGFENFMKMGAQFGLTLDSKAVAAADHLNDVIEVLKIQLNRAAFAIGGVLEPVLTPLAERLVRIGSRIIEWVKKNGELIRSIAKITVVTIALGVAIFTFGLAFLLAAKSIGLVLLTILTLKTAFLGFLSAVQLVVAALSTQLGLLAGILGVITIAFLIWSGEGAKAIAWLSDRFKTLGSIVTKTLQGVTDALLSGDLTAAARILWLGVELVWKTGVGAIKEIWNRMWTSLISTGVDVLDQFKVAWLEVVTFVQKTWTTTWASIGDALDQWVFLFRNTFSGLKSFVRGIADEIALLFVPEEQRESVRGQLRQERLDREVDEKGGLAEEFTKRSEASAEQLKSDLAEIVTSYEAALARIGEANLGTNQMLQDDLRDGLQKTKDELLAASREWDRALIDAQWARGQVEEEVIGIGDAVKRRISDFPTVDELIDKIQVAGTFTSAMLLGRGGGGGVAERTAIASEKSAVLLKDLKDMAQKDGLVFEP